MRAAILEGESKFVIREVPDPVLDEDEVLIKVQYCGICGSDLDTFIGGVPISHGHEYSGDIVELGSHVKGWEVGDRVTAESISSCGECYWCRRGEMGICEKFAESWVQRTAAFATYTKARYQQLHRIPPELTYQEAALTEPLAVALHVVRLSGMQVGDVVAVLGLGPIGQLVARLAKISGARAVYATESSQSRIKLAMDVVDDVIDVSSVNPIDRIFELTGGRGPDVVFECAGVISTTQQSINLVRKGGIIVIAGLCFNQVEIPVSNLVLKELNLRGSMCFYPGEYASALNLMKDRRIDVIPLITDVMPLDDINEAFRKALRREGGKILITP